MLSIAVLSSERAARPGRADKTVTRHVSQAGSYQVTTARTGRPDATDAALGPARHVLRNGHPTGVSCALSQTEPKRRKRIFTVVHRFSRALALVLVRARPSGSPAARSASYSMGERIPSVECSRVGL